MKKKILVCILALCMMLPMVAACVAEPPAPAPGAQTPAPEAPQAPAAPEAPAAPGAPEAPAAPEPTPPGDGAELIEVGDWKIGIITGTVTQGEEEYLASRNMEERFGSDRIVRATYPDNFGAEMETTIANVLALADAGAQAIVFVQAVPGAMAAIQQTRELFGEDIFFFGGVMHEPPAQVAEFFDIALISDDLSMGRVIVEQAVAMGADTFGHISFPRHLGMENIAARRALLMETAAEYGLEWVELTAPDPMSEGIATTQLFILENVPRWIEEHGENIAFFSTNCGMQEPLITQIAAYGGLYPLQCCPSPFHALPSAFNISMEGREGDLEFLLSQLQSTINDMGVSGRFSTWPVPINMLLVETGVLYSIEFLEGRTDGRHDRAVLERIISEVAAANGGAVTLSNWPVDGGYLENFYRVLSDFVTF
ncbi:MAG: DUF3798 domain-containing protein [Oscillospiraceae bacterium]|nr:DUF3798 domain-containing protein [Oscillospiraceae bacterium]